MTSYAAILAASFASTLAGAAIAADLDDGAARVLTVRYSPQELTTAAGARRVALRIEAAANDACGGDNVLTATGATFAQCRVDAEAAAADQIGSDFLRRALGVRRDRDVAAR